MSVKRIYLDSSVIAKRYISEVGSDAIDFIFDNAEVEKVKIFFSIWNIGEVLGVFDKYNRKNLLSEDELKSVIFNFLLETIKLDKLKTLTIIPITASILLKSWLIILNHHVYISDALQIISAKEECDILISSDDKLVTVANLEELNAINVEKNPKKIFELLSS